MFGKRLSLFVVKYGQIAIFSLCHCRHCSTSKCPTDVSVTTCFNCSGGFSPEQPDISCYHDEMLHYKLQQQYETCREIIPYYTYIYLQYTCRKKCKYKYAALFFLNLLVKHTHHRCSDNVRMNWLQLERYLSHDCAVAVTYGKLAQYLLWLTSMIKLQDESSGVTPT